MPAYQQLVAVLWSLGIGAALIAIIYVTVSGGWFRRQTVDAASESLEYPEPVQPIHEFPEGIAEANGPVPMIVKLVVIGFGLWAIGYVVLFVQRGYTFS